MSDEGGVIGGLARIIGVADVPWFFRWAVGITIALFAGYLFMILYGNFADVEGAKALKTWILDAIKVVFGVIIGILSQSAGLSQAVSNNISGGQKSPD